MSIISIIIPVYKVEPYLRRCVDSIMAQTFEDYDVILVDDGSPDNCGAICDEYARKNNRIHVIHQENGGLSAARNTGINWVFENSDSEWLTFIDSDDWVVPEYLEFLLLGAKETGLNVVIGEYEETKGESLSCNNSSYHVEIYDTDKFYYDHIVTATVAWGKFYHKKCFNTIRFPIGRLHEDEFVTYKILFDNSKIGYIPTPLYQYYQNPNGIIKSKISNKRRIDIIESLIEQINYFSEKKLKKIEMSRLEICLSNIDRYRKEIDDNNKNFVNFLKKTLQMLLLKYHRSYPISKNSSRYKFAFPFVFYIYKKYKHCLSVLDIKN